MKIAILLVILCSSCATPYQPHGLIGGYSEEPLGTNKYLVQFRGNGYTSGPTEYKYALRRSLELCREKGFSDFKIIDDQSASKPANSVLISCVNTAH